MSIIQEALKKADTDINGTKVRVGQGNSASKKADTTAASAPGWGVRRLTRGSLRGDDPRAIAILVLLLIATVLVLAGNLLPAKKKLPVKSIAYPAAGDTQAAGLDSAQDPATSSLVDPLSGTIKLSAASGEPLRPSSMVFQNPADIDIMQSARIGHPNFTLNGIMYIEGSPRAIINNAMVETGDVVDQAKVLLIDKKSVVLQYNDAEITLNLK